MMGNTGNIAFGKILFRGKGKHLLGWIELIGLSDIQACSKYNITMDILTDKVYTLNKIGIPNNVRSLPDIL